ncbi:MAG: peptidylprolyl isomerase [Planctomycetales bacterium]|nr:peptidylprolyl isomerase [Planctomycetales bacterium]
MLLSRSRACALPVRWTHFALVLGLTVGSASHAVGQTKNKTPRRPAASQPAANAPRPATGTAAAANQQIVAVVNGQSIERKELGQQCVERYGNTVLESLVNKHLILDACRKQNIRITAEDIEAEIDRIAARFSFAKEHYLEMLRDQRNITAEQYRRDIVWPTLALQRLAADKLVVSQEELAREFESEYGEKVQVRMIALETQAKAEQILKEVKANPDSFGLAAKNHSQDPNSAAARGMIPPIRRHMGDANIEKACFALKPGEISPIVPALGQFLIFQCEKQLPAAHISPQYKQAAYDRLKERIVERKLRDEAGVRFADLQKSAKVVNVFNDPKLRQQQPGVAATINGVAITMQQLEDECIARHGINVLDSEINYRLLVQALKSKNVAVNSADIDAEVAMAAESYGYLTEQQKPDVQRWLKDVQESEGIAVETYIRDAVWPSVALKKLVAKSVEVTSDDLDKGFKANYGERVEVLAIVLGSQRKAQEVWDMARGNKTPQFFGELASQYSMEPVSKANMGEVPPIRRFSGQPQIEEEAFSLSAEDPLSAIVAMGDKYVIMYYLGKTEPVVSTPADVRDELARDIREKKTRLAMAQEFDRIRESAQIDNFLAGQSQAGSRRSVSTSAQPSAPIENSPAKEVARPSRTSPQLIRPASQRTRRDS